MVLDIIALFIALPIVATIMLFVIFVRRSKQQRAREGGAEGTASGLEWAVSRSDVGEGSSRLLWATVFSLSLLYMIAGVPKVTSADTALMLFENWGYPSWFPYVVGGVEFFCGSVLPLPRATFLAAIPLGLVMVGAVYTHLAYGDPLYAFFPGAALAGLVYVGYERRPERAWSGGAETSEGAERVELGAA
jgi:uncharacterized membrane protein YphA (DoxX/SURF4 family)